MGGKRWIAAGVLAASAWAACGLVVMGQLPVRAADPELESLERNLQTFFENVYDDADRAYDELLVRSPLRNQTDALIALKQRTKALPLKYGINRGFEQIAAKRIGRDLVLYKYLYHCESSPVVWYVTYYRGAKRNDGGDAWTVISLRFDTDLELLALGE